MQILLKADPELINQPDEEGYTPLHLAVIAGNKTILRCLLDKGADVNALDNERHSVVHWATVCGELEALDLVLEVGADASVEDIHGAYPIHYAAQMCGNVKKILDSANGQRTGAKYAGLAALKKLIQRGVPVDVTDRDGRQPLLWAASSGESPFSSPDPSSSLLVVAVEYGKIGYIESKNLDVLICCLRAILVVVIFYHILRAKKKALTCWIKRGLTPTIVGPLFTTNLNRSIFRPTFGQR